MHEVVLKLPQRTQDYEDALEEVLDPYEWHSSATEARLKEILDALRTGAA